LFERWIKEGARDDTPPEANSFKLSAPPVYTAAPVISAITFSPTENILGGLRYHEVLLHKSDGSGMLARLVASRRASNHSPFRPTVNCSPSAAVPRPDFGEIQIWDAESHQELHSYKLANDSLFGASFSPDGKSVAFGCPDKTVRLIGVSDGKELMKFDNHSDWVLATTFQPWDGNGC